MPENLNKFFPFVAEAITQALLYHVGWEIPHPLSHDVVTMYGPALSTAYYIYHDLSPQSILSAYFVKISIPRYLPFSSLTRPSLLRILKFFESIQSLIASSNH